MWVKLTALSLSSILSYMLIGISLVAAAPRCYETGNFTTNSTYGRNRDLLLASLPSNVSANGGFFNTTIGQSSDKVYSLAMCKGDSIPDAITRLVPTMVSVVLMLSSYSMSLPVPSRPAISMNTNTDTASLSNQSEIEAIQASVNEASISELYPR